MEGENNNVEVVLDRIDSKRVIGVSDGVVFGCKASALLHESSVLGDTGKTRAFPINKIGFKIDFISRLIADGRFFVLTNRYVRKKRPVHKTYTLIHRFETKPPAPQNRNIGGVSPLCSNTGSIPTTLR